MEKVWKILDENPEDLKKALLKNRNIQNQEAFFHPHLYKLTQPDKLFADLEKAVDRIQKAIKNKELIYIYGDFDVDGITGTAILWETIDFLGGKVMPFIPHREKDGYGIHIDAIEKLAKEEAKVVISVDCGITAIEESKAAKKLGVDLIITDHHSIQKQIPKPLALIHTTSLAGSGVAFMLAKILLESSQIEGDEQLFKNLELAAIGTVADMVPLTGDNRVIVKNGLHSLVSSRRLGLMALYEEAGISKKIGTYEIGFMISPRLNAAGRMETAMDSLRLLLTKSKERAYLLSKKLGQTNKERQEATRVGLELARKSIELDGKTKIFVVHHKSYAPGVIGLVAGRLVDEYYRPSVVISENENLSKGSARSVKGFNITEAIALQKEYLQSHGGHPMAAGFSLEKRMIPKFKDKILNHAEKNLNTKNLVPTLFIDAKLDSNFLNTDTLRIINEFKPFGIGNTEPVFSSSGLEIVKKKRVGNGSKHLKMVLRNPNYKIFGAIGFGLGEKDVKVGERVDVAFNLKEDDWNGNGRFELKVKDIKPAES